MKRILTIEIDCGTQYCVGSGKNPFRCRFLEYWWLDSPYCLLFSERLRKQQNKALRCDACILADQKI